MLKKEELLCIYGGVNWTSAFINAILRGGSLFLELGRSVGSSIRRAFAGTACPI